ncbi:MAG TPA: trehalose-phosphatase, partial [bacterium]|nr:trehalose-phosphatase [bacterium]
FWDKGKGSKWIWENIAPGYLPVYFGDDTTDEDAFKELKSSGITVRVGLKKSSKAEYYVREIDDAAPLMKWLLEEYGRWCSWIFFKLSLGIPLRFPEGSDLCRNRFLFQTRLLC